MTPRQRLLLRRLLNLLPALWCAALHRRYTRQFSHTSLSGATYFECRKCQRTWTDKL